MAIAYTSNFATNDGSATLAYPNAMASAGFLVAVIRRGGTSSQPTDVSDDRNGAWAKAIEVTEGTDHTLGIWYRENGGSGAAVTVTQTGGAGTNRWIIGEWTGVATSSSLDQTASATGTGTAYDSGATATTAQADELAIGAASVQNSTAFAAGGSGTWTEVAEISSKAQMQYQILTATGTPNSAPTGISDPSLG